MIDIVVPIYNAFHVLKDCLSDLEKYSGSENCIYLINDCSTNKEIKPYIDDIANKNDWHVEHNKNNIGFVKSANKGLMKSQNHCILLNSDTRLTQPWLLAFNEAIKNEPLLGTATPWSNNAEICSFPKFLKNQKPQKDINNFAKDLYNKYQPQYPEIPTAVGFCMLITQMAKKQVGYFDEEHFGHGYGEENDYSIRIKNAGLKNILCDNAYIVHIGNESFKQLGLQPNQNTMNRLLQKQPEYMKIIEEYIKENPLEKVREIILETLNNTENKNGV